MSTPRTVNREELLTLLESPVAIEQVDRAVDACAIVLPAPSLSTEMREQLASVVTQHEHDPFRLVSCSMLENILHTIDMMVSGHNTLMEALSDPETREATLDAIKDMPKDN